SVVFSWLPPPHAAVASSRASESSPSHHFFMIRCLLFRISRLTDRVYRLSTRRASRSPPHCTSCTKRTSNRPQAYSIWSLKDWKPKRYAASPRPPPPTIPAIAEKLIRETQVDRKSTR